MSDLLAHLNAPQLAAVTLPAQHALILAGAGSGKTRVLTTRIAWLISTGQVGPQGILAVTFTNKAAKEMQSRLAAMLPINSRGMWIGTFHGLCNRLLRAHCHEAGLPAQFQILDAADQLATIKRLLKNLNVDDQKFPPRELMHFINAHKEQGLRAAQAEAYDAFTSRRVELYTEYEAQCRREGVVDFAELLLRSYELLQRNEPLCQHYQARFRHILVDEFQDTNRLQYAWLKLLAGRGSVIPESSAACLFAVGDDDQSIYAFRGAEIGNMRDLQREFALPNVIRLEQNYRSHGNILDAANALIQQNRGRLGKKLWTEAGAGEPIRVFEAYSDVDEARLIIEELSELVRAGVGRHQIALLYRSNAQSRVLEHHLFTQGIPYRVHGGLRFFDRQEIKHALAYLRLIANPDDDTAFTRVVNFPTRGIGSRSIEALQEAAQQTNSSLYNAAASLAGKAGSAVTRFVRLIEIMRSETRDLPLPVVIDRLIEKSGLRQHYLAEKEGQDRLENLDELINAATAFLREENGSPSDSASDGEAVPDGGPLASFLAHASLEAGEHQAGEGEEAVQLMTVHAAKGLEFDVVFISGLEQGLFPHENAAQERDGLEEERRLMYVALTRARRRLYLSHAQTRLLHGQTRYCLPSSFLEELPATLLRRINRCGSQVSARPTSSPGGQVPTAVGGLRIGQNVRHARFGAGVIVATEGSGSEARVQVNFGAAGMKWLALGYARLTPA
ncbi:MAG TPA: 3'-5' exonuclease [Accumulibacter sp.]|uniref:UvrD-helicase domain-containing protein n=1 Tax=Accumulibacter sp. TaxID=2053492 RepID=UPI0006255CC3|nr:UvrD-helicase domain-containing protein [Accumulibacter sp.]MCQ1548931.1 UvrD-helicase domain-containing protein [Candidatus Accumulibacter phosphatis]MBN8517108.1 UvrD-helicase domain-containing protein [Accumulibacter sp.]MBO3709299.1 UvrD-helicase domain-containing protein [Accumulibacter sp.]MCM8578066.1 UvrD-helicase domain-containing protein [Accumulibacter sp.]HMW56968.1 3'-5' exonuclease [Accumulibacter sp.]